MPYCDQHGWGWEPGEGPSPCVSETLSFLLAVGIFATSILSKDSMRTVQRAAVAGSPAARVHSAQITLSLVQAVIALTGGFLSARPRGMLCGALVLHSLGWTLAWLASALAMQRNPAHCKRLFWWWLAGAVSNSFVLSGLHRASERRGHHLPAEIGCLSWLSFFGNATLVLLQLGKPELDDVESVYVRVVGREGVVPPNSGWQAFWAGGDAWSGIVDGGGVDQSGGRGCPASVSRWFGRWCCFGWLRRGDGSGGGGRRGDGTLEGGGGAWPIAAGQPGTTDTLNESLLGAVGFDESHGGGVGASPSKAKQDRRGSRVSSWSHRGGGAQRGGCFRRVGHALSSVVGRGSKVSGDEHVPDAEQWQAWRGGGGAGGGGGARFLRRDSYGREVGGASALGLAVGTAARPRRVRAQALSSSAYSGGASCAARPPPQAAAPVFGVAVTRWRLVDVDGVPSAYGALSDTVWTDRSTDRSVERSMGRSVGRSPDRSDNGSSSRTAAISEVEVAPEGQSTSPLSLSATLPGDSGLPAAGNGEGEPGPRPALLGVQFELAVRASGRGEMDWWGHGGGAEPGAVAPGQSAASAASASAAGRSAATTAGDWRVWRSSADVLALYDALALRFGQEFCGRVPRPKLKTAIGLTSATTGRSGGDESASLPSGRVAPPAAPHRVDMLRDARTMGAFLRSLLGLRQFLSTAVMDFLAQPPPAARVSPGAMIAANEKNTRNESAHGSADPQSWHGSDGDSVSDDSDDERGRGRGRVLGHGDGGRGGSFAAGKAADGVDPSSAGEAVAVAALATDYGQWLKRLAVKLRRATPSGQRLVRLRSIGPAVTGEQVVSWLVTSSGECRGDRASAVRLGQDMVSHRLLKPLCAGYDRPEDTSAAGGGGAGWGNGSGGSGAKSGGQSGGKSGGEHRSLFRSFDDAVGWLFAYEGDALRDPFAPPPATQVAVMTGTSLDVRITGWIETSDDEGAHVSFVVRTQVEATQEAWDAPRRYREFTQLRKRLLRLGIHLPTAGARGDGEGGGAGRGGAGGLGPDLPKKTWRSNKFDEGHLSARRAALEVYLQAAVEAALKTPHLAGHLVMRFLDPDESNLRLLCDRNPFASRSQGNRGTTGRGGGSGGGRGGGGGGGGAGQGEVGGVECESGEGSREDKAEAEDFDTLTDSLGGFG